MCMENVECKTEGGGTQVMMVFTNIYIQPKGKTQVEGRMEEKTRKPEAKEPKILYRESVGTLMGSRNVCTTR